MKLGAKWGELVQLVQKFVPRSHVGIFRNERTQSTLLVPELIDEDTTSTSTPAAPSPAPPDAPPPQAPPSGPITRARARELNFIMLLKNEGPEE